MTCLPALPAGCSGASWRPGLAVPARKEEIFASGREACGAALAWALACDRLLNPSDEASAPQRDERSWLWVQDRAAMRLGGRPYVPGLPVRLRHRLIHVAAEKPQDALFALEEGLRCPGLAFVIGEIAGNPRALNFTASRRLAVAAERHGVPLFLVRIDAERDPGAARMRWAVQSAASPPPRWNLQAPGVPSWRAELFRARVHRPGEWILRDDGGSLIASVRPAAAPDHDVVAGQSGDRSLAGQAGAK